MLIRFTKIFDIRFSMDLHILRCPEHNLIIFRKCLSVCIPPKFCGHCNSRINARKLMKLHAQMLFDINWCWLVFGVYRFIGGAAMQIFFLDFGIFTIIKITGSIAWNCTILYVWHTYKKKTFVSLWCKSLWSDGAAKLHYP